MMRVDGNDTATDETEVSSLEPAAPDDADIAERARCALEWSASAPDRAVRVTVSDGWLTLEGEVEWLHERHAAEDAVCELGGVRGITNLLVVKPGVRAETVRDRIAAAFRHSAEMRARKIVVETTGAIVTLRGTIRSWAEHEDALNAARSTPGVAVVEDRLTIRP
jgi:osmotically-inducible protein OsmY